MSRKLFQSTMLRMLVFSFVMTFHLIDLAQEPIPKFPKIALVLSGGGAKGFAHIGVIKILEEEGIPIDLIVGTSIGALVGGIYSLGYNAEELEILVKSLDLEITLSDEVPREFLSKNDQLIKQRYLFSLPIIGVKKLSLPQGLVKGQNVLNIFCGLAGNVPYNAEFEKFPISFACVATDLETGKEVILKNGFLPTAMFSSMAIPIAYQSIDRDEHLLVDGGLVNNFPTDVAKRMGADIIIGVDIRNDFYDRKNLKSINNVLGQLVSFFDQEKDSTNKSICDLIIRPDITGYSISSFNNQAVDTLILRGEKAANGVRKQLHELKTKYQLESPVKSRKLVKPDKWYISDLTFTGNYQLDPDFPRKTLNIEIPGNFSSEEIKTAIDRIYGLGGFERIYYNLIKTEDGNTLNLNISSKMIFAQNIGFKANTTDAAVIMINTTRKNYKNVFGLLSVSAELSINPGLSIVAESKRINLPTMGINIKGKFQNYDIFEKQNKIYEANIFYSSGSIYIYQTFLKRFILGAGLQEEYYQGDIFSKNPNADTSDKKKFFLSNAYSYLTFDNMDDFYFPSKGTNMYAEIALPVDFQKRSEISPILLFKMRNVIPVWQNITLLFDFYSRAIYNPDTPRPQMTMVGGEPYSQYFNYHIPFVGLPAVNIAERFTCVGLVGLRFHITSSQYLSLLFNGMRQSSNKLIWDNASMIYGGGIRYSFKSILGPLDMTLGYSGWTEKPTFSANFGYWF